MRPPTIHGGIDGVLADGTIAGWAWQPGSAERAHVRILADGEVVAEALADWYRADLLRAGMGLGHCGFYARPRRALAAGEHALELLDVRHGVPIGSGEPKIVTMPGPDAAEARRSLFQPRPTWRDEEVLEAIGQFGLARQCRAMGAARYLDVVFRYVLGRWADEAGLAGYTAAIESGASTPEEVFRDLLTSEERRGMREPLPSPYDYRFPFRPPAPSRTGGGGTAEAP